MAAIWDNLKNNTIKTKIRGEIALLEREMKSRQRKFGVELYDLLVDEKKSPLSELIKTPELFSAVEKQIKEPFESCKADIHMMEAERAAHKDEVQRSQANKDRAMPASTAGQMFSNAGSWMKGTASEVNHQTQIALIDTKVKSRKESFGIEAFAVIDKTPAEEKESLQAKLSHVISKLSEHEKKVSDCIEQAKKDVGIIQKKIQAKESEIASLG